MESPFFSLGFFGEAKKSKSPAAATERHRNFVKNPGADAAQGFYRLNPNGDGNGTGSGIRKQDSDAGVFGAKAQIPQAFSLPCACCASRKIMIRPQKPGSVDIALLHAAKSQPAPENHTQNTHRQTLLIQ